MKLTPTEAAFLEDQGLVEADVLDGSGLSHAEARCRARELGKTLRLGSPCRKAGHRLRTSAGHCVQCDSRKLAFVLRHRKKGYVYIAGSIEQQLIKLGGSEQPESREQTLRDVEYAGATDWEMLVTVEAREYGRLEFVAQKFLKKFATREYYEKDGAKQQAREVFRCGIYAALDALEKACRELGVTPPSADTDHDLNRYEF